MTKERRVFRFGDDWYSAPIAYLRDDEPMLEAGPHRTVNAKSAVRLGLATCSSLVA